MMEHLFWSTLAAVAAVLLAFALRRRSAALRHAILLAALVRFALPTAWLTRAGAVLAGYLPARPSPVLQDFPWALIRGDAAVPPPQAPSSHDPANLYWLLWAAGATLCGGIWLRSLLSKVPAVRDPNPEETSAFAEARLKLGVAMPVALRIAPAGQTPGARGWRRPCVIVPDFLRRN